MNYRLIILLLALAFVRPFGVCMVRTMVPGSEMTVASITDLPLSLPLPTEKGCASCSSEESNTPEGKRDSQGNEHPCCQRDLKVVSPRPAEASALPTLDLATVVAIEIHEPVETPRLVKRQGWVPPIALFGRSAILLRLACALLI